jgi:cell division protein FtsI (penicillin-binding protein 3)
MAAQNIPSQQEIIRRRMPLVIGGLVAVAILMVARLASFQFQLPPDVLSYLQSLRDAGYTQTLELAAERGVIYDRNGEPLAVNTLDYRVGISPNLVADPQAAAVQLAGILGLNELEVYEQLRSDQLWVQLSARVPAAVRQQLNTLDISGITASPIPRRSYPQGPLGARIIGFVGGDLEGYYGVEGFWNDQLAGQIRDRTISNIPFDIPEITQVGHGRDLILTIDRDLQFLAENELLRAVTETGSERGMILIMNPTNGEILAMASSPSFDPNAYFNVEDPQTLANPIISDNYEPGSVMKVITVAAALDRGAITPDWGYNDVAVLDVAGIPVVNWDRRGHGYVDVTNLLVQSLNVGAASVAQEMGIEAFYSEMDEFGFGRLTQIDLEGEEAGLVPVPGDSNWSEANFITSSFGQGISVTPLQMLTAVNAIANDGLIMTPHVVREIVDGDTVIPAQPSVLKRAISAEVAQQVTQMMVAVINNGLDSTAVLEGYTIAGKTGTAQVPDGIGYRPGVSIATFVGFLPADDPQISILIRLDAPRNYWASATAAPVFGRLVERLVIMMEIPNDAVRAQLAAEGGSVNNIQR